MATHVRPSFKEYIFKQVLRRVCARPCSDTVPRTVDEGERMNCFGAFMCTTDGEPFLLLESLDGDLVRCRQLGNFSYSQVTTEQLRDLVSMNLRIVHCYGLHRIEFDGVWHFLWHRFTRLMYFKLQLKRAWDTSVQLLSNRRDVASKRRMDILRLLVLDRLSGKADGLNHFTVMRKLYSIRWFNHPAQEERSSEVKLILEALQESGDAYKTPESMQYVATKKALMTLE